jgi:hypothetical protein
MTSYFELPPGATSPFDPTSVARDCVESGARGLLIDRAALPPEFLDLSTGVTGELLHRLSMYGIRLAAVIPSPSRCSRSFQDFVREANHGDQFRFFATREDAVHWLESPAERPRQPPPSR